MPKKTIEKYEFINKCLSDKGYKLTTSLEDYLNIKGKQLIVECLKHGEYYTDYTKVRLGNGCKKCADEKLRTPIEKAVIKFQSKGFSIINPEVYVDGNSRVNIECSNKHKFSSTYNKIMAGGGCLECAHMKMRKSKEDLIELFEGSGFKIVDGLDTYKDKDSRITIQCSLGHKYDTTYGSFGYSGKNCAICTKTKPHSLNYITDMFHSKGLIPLFSVYVNAKTLLKFRCPHHSDIIQEVTYLQLLNNIGCKLCGREKISGQNHYCWKGGVSSFNDFLRTSITPWKMASLNHYDYKCVISGDKNDLVVHHALVNFCDITQEVMSMLSLSELVLKSKVNEIDQNILMEAKSLCLQKHMDYGYGVPLRSDIHKEFHKQYGYHNNTFDQFLEFKSKYK